MHSIAHQSLDSSIKMLEGIHAHLSKDDSGHKSDIMASMIKAAIDSRHHFKNGLTHHKAGANIHKNHMRKLAMGVMSGVGLMSGVKAADFENGQNYRTSTVPTRVTSVTVNTQRAVNNNMANFSPQLVRQITAAEGNPRVLAEIADRLWDEGNGDITAALKVYKLSFESCGDELTAEAYGRLLLEQANPTEADRDEAGKAFRVAYRKGLREVFSTNLSVKQFWDIVAKITQARMDEEFRAFQTKLRDNRRDGVMHNYYGEEYYLKANPTPQDMEFAENLFRRSDELGNTAGTFNLGKLLLTKNDTRGAEFLFEKVCRQGFQLPSNTSLAVKNLWDSTVRKLQPEFDAAKYFAEEAELDAARREENGIKLLAFALAYEYGENGKDFNIERASILFKQGAKNGEPMGWFHLAMKCFHTDPTKSKDLFKRAYVEGANHPTSPPELVQIWNNAIQGQEAERENYAFHKEISIARRQGGGNDGVYDLSWDYIQGRNGKIKDEKHAVKLLEWLDSQKYANGSLDLGQAYLNGLGGLVPNEGKAKELFEKAIVFGGGMTPTFTNPRALELLKEVEKDIMLPEVVSLMVPVKIIGVK
jgi:TPR repeat protein